LVRARVVGSTNVDLVLTVDGHPVPGETVLACDAQRLAGGKGANQAVALARLGAEVVFVSAVGDDADGRWSLEQLVIEGVDVTDVAVVDAPTGLAVVTLSAGGENSIVVVPGANQHVVAPADEPVDVVLLSLEVPLPVIEEAAATDAVVVLNAAPFHPLPAALLDLVDVLVVNEVEQQQLGPVPCATVVTLGSAGARVGDVVLPAPPVEVVDTTGAGDCFAAALAYGLGAGEDLVTAARRAVVAASLSVRALGARAGLPSRAEVEELGHPG
jgi:ribokinase